MRGAALADLHLGFRAFQATENGRNVREQDTERAWEAAVDGVIEAQPDLVTIAGDCFHHPRVSDFAKRAFLRGIVALLEGTYAHVIILQGNHDAGRTAEVLTPIALADVLGVAGRLHVVTEPKRIRFDTKYRHGPDIETVSVACFPFVARTNGETYALEPDPDADVNVLLMHAAVKGSADGDRLPYFYGGDQPLDVGREADRWDVIACGDYHEFTRLHPSRLAFYSGSLERTSSNIWQEHAPKGWVLYETDGNQGTLEFIKVPTRPMLDFSLDGFGVPPGSGAEGVNECLRLMAADPERNGTRAGLPDTEPLTGAIVRLKVDSFPRAERDAIDWSLVREIKHKALHFQLDLKYGQMEVADLGDRRERGRALSLAEEAASFFSDDPAEVRALALRCLDVEAEVEDVAEMEVAAV